MLRSLVSRVSSAFRRSPPVSTVSAEAILDVLPASCEIIAEFNDDQVRFRAVDEHGFKSEWSGWFNRGEPIVLTWAAFWVGD